MKLNPAGFASALGITSAILYFVCGILAAVTPQFLLYIFKTWFHGMNLDALVPADGHIFNLTLFIIGLITFTATGWGSGWLVAIIYNLWQKKSPEKGE